MTPLLSAIIDAHHDDPSDVASLNAAVDAFQDAGYTVKDVLALYEADAISQWLLAAYLRAIAEDATQRNTASVVKQARVQHAKLIAKGWSRRTVGDALRMRPTQLPQQRRYGRRKYRSNLHVDVDHERYRIRSFISSQVRQVWGISSSLSPSTSVE